MKDKFEITPEMIKKRRDKHAEKERLLFLAMCNKHDRKIINEEEKFTVEDFDRIGYLLETLGFDNFGWNFSFGHQELLNELGAQIESEVEGTIELDLNETYKTTHKWGRDFCEGLPSNEMKPYFKRIFNISE